jgi:hypothetical protein
VEGLQNVRIDTMIAAILAIAVLAPTGQAQRPDPGTWVTKMLSHYNGANSLAGHISFTQSAANTSIKGDTQVQYERPSKLFVRQALGNDTPTRIISDGKKFLYSLPAEAQRAMTTMNPKLPQDQELVENVVQASGPDETVGALDIGQIYAIASSGLAIRPPALDVAIARREDLKAFVDQFATVEDQGDSTVNGKAVHLIGGDWRQYADALASGKYQLAVTGDGDLVRYGLTEQIADPRPGQPPIVLTTTWDVDLKIGGSLNEDLFKDNALVQRETAAKGGG